MVMDCFNHCRHFHRPPRFDQRKWRPQEDLFSFDVGKLDHFGPFFSVVGDAFSEFGRRHRQRFDAQADKARFHGGIQYNCVDLTWLAGVRSQ